MAKTKDGLNPKQKRFCEEYLIDLNGTQAAIRAGYSKKTSGQISEENLKKPEIKEYVKILMDQRAESTKITAEMVIKELGKVGFANIQDYIKKGFTIEDIQSLQKDHAAAVESVKVKETGGDYPSTEVSFKLHDKISALEKLGRHLGIFEKDNQQQNIKLKQKVILPGGTIIEL